MCEFGDRVERSASAQAWAPVAAPLAQSTSGKERGGLEGRCAVLLPLCPIVEFSYTMDGGSSGGGSARGRSAAAIRHTAERERADTERRRREEPEESEHSGETAMRDSSDGQPRVAVPPCRECQAARGQSAVIVRRKPVLKAILASVGEEIEGVVSFHKETTGERVGACIRPARGFISRRPPCSRRGRAERGPPREHLKL